MTGQYKSPGLREAISVQRGRAQSAEVHFDGELLSKIEALSYDLRIKIQPIFFA